MSNRYTTINFSTFLFISNVYVNMDDANYIVLILNHFVKVLFLGIQTVPGLVL